LLIGSSSSSSVDDASKFRTSFVAGTARAELANERRTDLSAGHRGRYQRQNIPFGRIVFRPENMTTPENPEQISGGAASVVFN